MLGLLFTVLIIKTHIFYFFFKGDDEDWRAWTGDKIWKMEDIFNPIRKTNKNKGAETAQMENVNRFMPIAIAIMIFISVFSIIVGKSKHAYVPTILSILALISNLVINYLIFNKHLTPSKLKGRFGLDKVTDVKIEIADGFYFHIVAIVCLLASQVIRDRNIKTLFKKFN
tara:strand:- start:1235 stop:1744 length:510 start_codon:yes stop_codon:yes gene_type:complete